MSKKRRAQAIEFGQTMARKLWEYKVARPDEMPASLAEIRDAAANLAEVNLFTGWDFVNSLGERFNPDPEWNALAAWAARLEIDGLTKEAGGANEDTELSRLFKACTNDWHYEALEELCFSAGLLWRCNADTEEFSGCGYNNDEDAKTCADCGAPRPEAK